nr:ArsR family transcriptional regulator [Bacillus haynesii]
MADPTRRKLLRLLAEGGVLSFKELIIHFDMSLLGFQSIWQSLKMQAS